MVVSFFQHVNYKGYKVDLEVGEYLLEHLIVFGIRNNDLSSLKLPTPNNYRVHLYSNLNLTGELYVTTSDIPNFVPLGWNDKVSSIKIEYINALSPDPAPDPTPAPAPAPAPDPTPDPVQIPSSLVESNIYNNARDAIVTILGVSGNSKWTGSGFFIKRFNKYYIVSVAHNVITSHRGTRIDRVVASISNKNNTGQHIAYECSILGVGALADIAVLEVNGLIENQKYLEWGDCRNETPGNTCHVIGDPKGVDAISISSGVIRDNKFSYNNSIELISTDAAVYGGNSGSPILNKYGKVIGIISFSLGDGNSLSAGASQYIMEHVVNKIIDTKSDYIGGVLNINIRPVTSIFLESYNILPYYLEGYYVTSIKNGTFQYNNNEIIISVIENGKEYRLGLYHNQYPISSFIYKNAISTITLRMKNIYTKAIRDERINIYKIDQSNDKFDGDIIINRL